MQRKQNKLKRLNRRKAAGNRVCLNKMPLASELGQQASKNGQGHPGSLASALSVVISAGKLASANKRASNNVNYHLRHSVNVTEIEKFTRKEREDLRQLKM